MRIKSFKLFENKSEDLRMCFEGFSDLGFKIVYREGSRSTYKTDSGEIRSYSSTNSLNSNTVYISTITISKYPQGVSSINSDFRDEMESSIGKAEELGFKLDYIFFYPTESGLIKSDKEFYDDDDRDMARGLIWIGKKIPEIDVKSWVIFVNFKTDI